MFAIIEINVPIVAQSTLFSTIEVDNFGDVIGDLTVTGCPFTIEYNSVTYEGVASKNVGDTLIQLVFDDAVIALPSDMCVEVICELEVADHTHCFPTEIVSINASTKLMVVDDDGCPIGNVDMATITAYIITQLNIPGSLCDLLGSNIPEGPLVAADRILTTVSGGCTLKSVPQTDVICP